MEPPPKTIECTFNKIRQLNDKGASSTLKRIGDFNWRIVLYKIAHKLDIWLQCEEKLEKNDFDWFCLVMINTNLVNTSNDSPSISQRSTARISGKHLRFKILNTSWSKLVCEDLIKDGTLTIQVRVKVTRSGRRDKPVMETNFFAPSDTSDVILYVQGTKLYVCREILSLHSSVFKSLIVKKCEESQSEQLEISVDDVAVEEMVHLLNAVYAHFQYQTLSNVLKLAAKFDMPLVRAAADNFLAGQQWVDVKYRLILANKYNLTFSLDDCMCSFKTPESIMHLQQMEEYESLSDDVKDELSAKASGLLPID